MTEAHDYGSRGLEMLKSHSELRKYLAYRVDNDQVGVSSEAIEKKNALINALDRINKNVSETGLFRRYTKLYKQQKNELDIANQILDVEKGQNEVNFGVLFFFCFVFLFVLRRTKSGIYYNHIHIANLIIIMKIIYQRCNYPLSI